MKFIKNIVSNWKWYQNTKKLKKERELNEIKHLVKEFNLIQEKKSLLSKKNRDKVEKKIMYLIEHKILEVKL